MDPLDEIFATMRVQSAVYARLEAGAPWGLSFAAGVQARFGLVVRGGCWLSVDAHAAPIALATGDCFLLAGGLSYVLRDDMQSPTQNCVDVVKENIGGVVELGGAGARTTIINGWFAFDRLSARPLIDALPPVLHVRMDQDRTHLLQSTLQLFAMETSERQLGSGIVISRLADIIFVQAVRAYVASLEGQSAAGWLAALSDKKLAPALRAIHGDPARPWTVQALAVTAGQSRSSFAAHFRDRVGESPLEYLTRWRMFRAGCLLRQSDKPLGEIAALIGYESEPAFSKAFKKVVGTPPGMYRRGEKLS